MAATVAGISSLGVTFGYGVETTKGEKPSSFSQLERVNNIGGIALSVAQIEASSLEDVVTRYVAGRGDSGGQWSITFNLTDETKEQIETAISAYNGLSGGKRMWFEVIVPGLTEAFFVVAQMPQKIPMPEIGQDSLMTVEIVLTIEEYKGFDTKVAFS